jgi:pilus assembly protein Flp/PilA
MVMQQLTFSGETPLGLPWGLRNIIPHSPGAHLMTWLLSIGKHLRGNDRGATAIEYGLIAALLVIGVMAAIQSTADTSIAMWTKVSSRVATATSK